MFIALYKAFRGGEWLRASLDSLLPQVDAVVAVVSVRPWMPSLPYRENCVEVFETWRLEHPDVRVKLVHGEWRRQEDQLRAGLNAITETWGPHVQVLVVDTDEVWPSESLSMVKAAAQNPGVVPSRLWTYARSPLFQVWPQEKMLTPVGLPSALIGEFGGRFRGLTEQVPTPGVVFHHMAYVREDEDEIKAKFLNTASQEPWGPVTDWCEITYAGLPEGQNVHPTLRYRDAWQGFRCIVPGMLPVQVQEAPAFRHILDREERAWKARLRRQTAQTSIWPSMTDADKPGMWDQWRCFLSMPPAGTTIKCSPYEALVLADFASRLPHYARVLEIGSGHGGSLACMAAAAPATTRFVCVDPFLPYVEVRQGVARRATEGDEAAFRKTVADAGLSDRVRLVKSLSHEARVNGAVLGPFDLILVDGNHSEPNVVEDMLDCWEMLAPGGTLLGHDYSMRFPEVIRGTDTFEQRAQVSVSVWTGTSLCYVRGPR